MIKQFEDLFELEVKEQIKPLLEKLINIIGIDTIEGVQVSTEGDLAVKADTTYFISSQKALTNTVESELYCLYRSALEGDDESLDELLRDLVLEDVELLNNHIISWLTYQLEENPQGVVGLFAESFRDEIEGCLRSGTVVEDQAKQIYEIVSGEPVSFSLAMTDSLAGSVAFLLSAYAEGEEGEEIIEAEENEASEESLLRVLLAEAGYDIKTVAERVIGDEYEEGEAPVDFEVLEEDNGIFLTRRFV